MDKEEAYKRYHAGAVKLAYRILDIADIRDSMEYTSQKCEDNGDVGMRLDEALDKLGIALAHALVYANEYKNEHEGVEDVDAGK